MATTTLKQAFAATVLAVFAASSSAGVLYSQDLPIVLTGLDGIQADGATGVYPQSFSVAPGSVLESIVWYGFHGPDSKGPVSDVFTVQIDGVDVIYSSITSSVFAAFNQGDLYKYTLDVVDTPVVSSGTFALANGPDTEWFWQFSNADIEATAFTFNGTPGTAVPEPQTGALILLGLAAVAGTRRRNRCA